MIGARKKGLITGVKRATPFTRSGSFESDQDGFVFDGFARSSGAARTGNLYLYVTRENPLPFIQYTLAKSEVAKLYVDFSIWGTSTAPSQGTVQMSTNGGASFTTVATKPWTGSFEQITGGIRVGATGLIIRFTHNNANGRFDDWMIRGYVQ